MSVILNPEAGLPVELYDIGTTLGHSVVEGDVGLEIEVEGNYFRKESYKDWKYVHDGSLRGQDNAEYVFKKPLPFDKVDKALDELWLMFSADGSVLDVSNRTSVHVHLNVQRFSLPRFCAFTGLWFCVEELLAAWCGEHRVGNLFCLRAKDAPAIVSRFKDFFLADGHYNFSNGNHYAGFNGNALNKFGSIEIRYLRGPTEPETIKTWVKILKRLYDMSAEFNDPRDVCSDLSGYGPYPFLERILGEYTSTVVEGSGMTYHQVTNSVYEGVRYAQDICYCRDWSLVKEADVKNNPFRRKKTSTSPLGGAQWVPAGSFATLAQPVNMNMINNNPSADYLAEQIAQFQTYYTTASTNLFDEND